MTDRNTSVGQPGVIRTGVRVIVTHQRPEPGVVRGNKMHDGELHYEVEFADGIVSAWPAHQVTADWSRPK